MIRFESLSLSGPDAFTFMRREASDAGRGWEGWNCRIMKQKCRLFSSEDRDSDHLKRKHRNTLQLTFCEIQFKNSFKVTDYFEPLRHTLPQSQNGLLPLSSWQGKKENL
ncbi:hypothetical protein CEXT_804071 [Caerostris extrusa]|uniref:Uncharacterized protein n=1 Tax=Caerostris extrusa TaxID=172846 RepID=A0AAV4Y3T6_CAEEX|nr:hypothetical protein CEXT_804071 [Caerostris extrusa]